MSDGHGHQPADIPMATATDAATVTDRDMAIVVTTTEAARLADVSARTIRRWIAQGHLPAIDSERGQLVSPADLSVAAERARQSRGHGHGQGYGRGHDRVEDDGHGHQSAAMDTDAATATAISVAGRAQLDAIMQEWLAPLIDRIATLEREAGALEAASRVKDETISTQREALATQAERVAEQQATLAELRRRAEAAEAERDRLAAAQAAPEAPHESRTLEADVHAPDAPGSFLARVRRLFGGGGG